MHGDMQSKEGQGENTSGLPKSNDYHLWGLHNRSFQLCLYMGLFVLFLPMTKYRQRVST